MSDRTPDLHPDCELVSVDATRAVLEEALYIGLDAVTQGRVVIRERTPIEEVET